MDPAKSPLERGDFLVRNLVGADQSSGALAVAERVRVGQTGQFQLRDAEASREDLGRMLEEVAVRLGGRRPAFGCYFDCAGRGRGLFGVPDHDVTLIRERLGAFPLVGFFGNGEFADRPPELLPQLHRRARGLPGGLRPGTRAWPRATPGPAPRSR